MCLKKIRETKIERFNNIIQAMKTHKLLDGLGADIYDKLHHARSLRGYTVVNPRAQHDYTYMLVEKCGDGDRPYYGPSLFLGAR